MDIRPAWLDEYADIINKTRNKFVKIHVVEEANLQYAIIRLFARTTISMCEIYTLMNNGYPMGAFALSRQIYESIALMDYLIAHKNDAAMIERYFDDIEISSIKIQIKKESYIKAETTISAADQLKKYIKKYQNFYDEKKGFTDYWWVKKNGIFSDIVKESQYHKYYMYKATSSVIHMSLFNSMAYLGNNQTEVLIGETYDGIEQAGWYSMLCYCAAMTLLEQVCTVNLNDLISLGCELEERISENL